MLINETMAVIYSNAAKIYRIIPKIFRAFGLETAREVYLNIICVLAFLAIIIFIIKIIATLINKKK